MNIQVGDRVKMMTYGVTPTDVLYTVLAVEDDYIKVKHPEIGGYFHFAKSRVESVIPKGTEKK